MLTLPTRHLLRVASFVTSVPLLAAEPPAIEDCEAALLKAVRFFHEEVAIEGGYAFRRPLDLSYAEAEHAKGTSVVSIQPPGTPTAGLAFLEAWQATGERICLTAARSAATALLRCQLASGGWPSEFDFQSDAAKKYHLQSDLAKGDTTTGKRRNHSTLDDNKTQSALLFLLELAHDPAMREDSKLQRAVETGLRALLAAQAPNGGWPQQFTGPADPTLPVAKAEFPEDWPRTWPNEDYRSFYTLNDGNHLRCIEVLLRAHELTGEPRFLERAIKAGDFLLRARMPSPQPVWAQQYDSNMHPVWARKFEPPAVASVESVGAMEALMQLWIATGKSRFVDDLEESIQWFEGARLADGRWARFYELRSNRPLYMVRDSYQLTYEDDKLPTHYGFKIDASLERKLERFLEKLETNLNQLRSKAAGPQSKDQWAKEARDVASSARRAIESLDQKGRWTRAEMIETKDFVSQARALARCILAQKKSR